MKWDKRTDPPSARTLRNKLWWMNIFGAIVTLGSLGMVIAAIVLGWSAGDIAVFTMFATSGVNSLRIETENLLGIFMAKYRKDHGLEDPKTKDNKK